MVKKSFFFAILYVAAWAGASETFASGSRSEAWEEEAFRDRARWNRGEDGEWGDDGYPHRLNEWENTMELMRSLSTPKMVQGTDALFRMAQDSQSPHQFDAIDYLWNYPHRENTVPVRNRLAPFLIPMAQDPRNPHQWKALVNLLNSSVPEHVSVARESFLPLLQNTGSPIRDRVIDTVSALSEETKDLFRPFLREITQDPQDPARWKVVDILWRQGNAEDRAAARSALLSIAQDPQDKKQWSATATLWQSSDAADHLAGNSSLFAMIRNHKNGLLQNCASDLLLEAGNEEEKAAVRALLREIAFTPDVLYQMSAIMENPVELP